MVSTERLRTVYEAAHPRRHGAAPGTGTSPDCREYRRRAIERRRHRRRTCRAAARGRGRRSSQCAASASCDRDESSLELRRQLRRQRAGRGRAGREPGAGRRSCASSSTTSSTALAQARRRHLRHVRGVRRADRRRPPRGHARRPGSASSTPAERRVAWRMAGIAPRPSGSSGRCVPRGPQQDDDRSGPSRSSLPGERRALAPDEASRPPARGRCRPPGRACCSAHEATRPVLAAALLHDVGKIEADLGHLRAGDRHPLGGIGRAPRPRHRSERWTRTRGFTRRVGLYLQHPELGGDLLGAGRQRPAHRGLGPRAPPARADEWTVVPTTSADALKDADDD